MSIATLTGYAFFAPLQGLWQWFKPPLKHAHRATARPPLPPCPVAIHLAPDLPSSSTLAPHTGHRLALRRPLRVLRVVESGQSRAQVGHLRISGRMADVCAELDRLAAGEALFH